MTPERQCDWWQDSGSYFHGSCGIVIYEAFAGYTFCGQCGGRIQYVDAPPDEARPRGDSPAIPGQGRHDAR